jgi:short-subunit dehydrogenase
MNDTPEFPPKNDWVEGKTVLITGATNGTGRALALRLSDSAKVIAHGRSQSKLNQLAKAAPGRNITAVLGDLGIREGWQAVESVIRERQPEAMILNAGYNCRKVAAAGWTDSEVFEMLQVNMISPILLSRTFLSLPPTNEPRRLALILSTSCHYPRANMSLYITSKMGLLGFGRAIQQEAKDLNVRTTLFFPGRTNSGFRKVPNDAYMHPNSVAKTIASILSLPNDVVPYEFTFRPEVDINT